MESRLIEMEASRAAEIEAAVAAARRDAEAEAAKVGRPANAATIVKAQDTARARVQADQAERIALERQRLDAERLPAAEQEARQKAATPAVTLTTAVPTSPATSDPPSPAPTPGDNSDLRRTTPAPVSHVAAVEPGGAPEGVGIAYLDSNDAGVTPPAVESQAPLKYPEKARAKKAVGLVVVLALIDEIGRVAQARLLQRSATDEGFNEAAIEHVKSRRYRPASKGGRPGPTWVQIRVEFRP